MYKKPISPHGHGHNCHSNAYTPFKNSTLSEKQIDIDLHRLLIYGFIRSIELEYYVPTSTINIVLSYYPSSYLVYAIGEDRNGFFGFGCNKHLSKFTKLPSWTFHCDTSSFIYYGMARFIIKTKFNKIYCAGRNEYGELGLGEKDDQIMIFKELKTKTFLDDHGQKNNHNRYRRQSIRRKSIRHSKMKKNKHHKSSKYKDEVKLISNGKEAYHTFIITKKNKFYVFGRNEYGQFGNGKTTTSSTRTPHQIWKNVKNNPFLNNQVNIVQIECGESHTIFLTSTGKLYSCGNNHYGQCGIRNDDKNNDNILKPTLVPYMDDVIVDDVKCGSFHNLCLTQNNKVYVFGNNECGQLGMYHRTYIKTAELQNYLNIFTINKIECGSNHSLCISNEKGFCYLFGDNEYGQIGLDHERYKVVNKPILFQSIKIKQQHKIQQSGSDDSKSNHDELPTPLSPYSSSNSLQSQSASPLKLKDSYSRMFRSVKIYSGSCSYLHTVLLTYNNEIITFGSNHNNQCSFNPDEHDDDDNGDGMNDDGNNGNKIQRPMMIDKSIMGLNDDIQIDSVIAAYGATILICLPTIPNGT